METGSKEEAQCPHSPQEEKGSITEMIRNSIISSVDSILVNINCIEGYLEGHKKSLPGF